MSKKSSSTSKPWKPMQDDVLRAGDALGNAYQSNAPKIQGMADQYAGGIGDFAMGQLKDGNAGVNAARDYNVSVLQGSLLEGNPHLSQMIQLSNDEISNMVNAQMGLKGLTGGSNHAGILADKIAKNTLGLRFQDYNNERSRQDAAAGRAGQLASAEYLPVQGLLASLGAQQAPLQAAGMYAGGLGGLLGGYQTQTSQKSPWDYIFQAAGNAAAAGAAASERRVKKNITKLGEFDDGLGVYSFNYTWEEEGAPLYHGVMVDEVEKLRPWALGPIVDGIQTVDYSRLGEAA